MVSQHAKWFSGYSQDFQGSLQLWYQKSTDDALLEAPDEDSVAAESSVTNIPELEAGPWSPSFSFKPSTTIEKELDRWGDFFKKDKSDVDDSGMSIPTALASQQTSPSINTERRRSSRTVGKLYTAPAPPCLVFLAQSQGGEPAKACLFLIEREGVISCCLGCAYHWCSG